MKELTVAEGDKSVHNKTRSTTHRYRNKYRKFYNNPLVIEGVS